MYIILYALCIYFVIYTKNYLWFIINLKIYICFIYEEIPS
jgi:hypothetical protein